MIAIRTARTALTALAVSVSSFGMPAYAASNVGSAARADSTPAAPGDGFTAPKDPGTHTDLTIGIGTQTGGVGFVLGHRTAGGLRVEGGLGTVIGIFGLSAAAGFSGTIYESARSRVEVPVLATFTLLTCNVCGTDSIRFAGDSGDGMQLTGTQFTERRPSSGQRPRDVPRLPGRDPRARRHHVRRLRLPAALLEQGHLHAGRRARRAGGDEPRGAEGATCRT
jgi:hypothetical protein